MSSVIHLTEGEELPEGFHVEEEKVNTPVTFTPAGPVKITKADGTVEYRPAYTEEELSCLVTTKRRGRRGTTRRPD